MSADSASVIASTPSAAADATIAKDLASRIADHFRRYNDEFGHITRRAARNFMNEAWVQGQRDAVERIELYEKCVTRCVAEMERALGYKRTEIALWVEIKRLYEILVARRPDGEFY